VTCIVMRNSRLLIETDKPLFFSKPMVTQSTDFHDARLDAA